MDQLLAPPSPEAITFMHLYPCRTVHMRAARECARAADHRQAARDAPCMHVLTTAPPLPQVSVLVLSTIGGLREAFNAAGFAPERMAWLAPTAEDAELQARARPTDCMLMAR